MHAFTPLLNDSTPERKPPGAGWWFCFSRHLLMFLGCFCLLPGCQRPPARDNAPVSLRILVPGGSIRVAVNAALEELSREHPELQVEVITAPGKDYYVKGLAMITSGTQLDLLWVGQGFGLFSHRGALYDLSELVAGDPDFDLSAYDPTVVDWYRYEERLYGIPYGVDVQAIIYNRDAFELAGLPVPDDGWTFEDYLQTARRLSQLARENRELPPYGAGVDLLRPFYFDLQLVGGDDGRFGMNGPAGREWLALNYEVLEEERSFLRVGAQGTLDRLGEFVQQRVVMAEVFSWDLPELKRRAPFRWDIVANPRTRAGRRVAWGSSSGFSMVAASRHPREAWLILKHLVAADFQRGVFSTTIPTITALHEEYLAANGTPPEHLRVFLETLPYLEPTPRTPSMTEVASEWNYWTQLALQGKQEPSDTLRRAEQSINRILEDQAR